MEDGKEVRRYRAERSWSERGETFQRVAAEPVLFLIQVGRQSTRKVQSAKGEVGPGYSEDVG